MAKTLYIWVRDERRLERRYEWAIFDWMIRKVSLGWCCEMRDHSHEKERAKQRR